VDSFQTSDNRAIAYNVIGSGPTLVCHPGGPGFAGAELGDLGGLSGSYRLIVVNPRGTGGSDPAPDYSLDGYAADLEELRVHLALERMDLLGFSYGAVVAISYATRYQGGLGRLVLAGGLAAFTDEGQAHANAVIASKAGEPWHADAVAALEQEERGEINDLAALWVREAPLYFAKWDESYRPAIVAGAVGARVEPLLYSNRVGFDVRGELNLVTAPTLIVCGRDDFVCGPPAAEDLANGISGAKLVMLENTGHMMFIEQPDAFRGAVADFLKPV
jgi:pimeloyl-ACP methyl ester carboxylesterase